MVQIISYNSSLYPVILVDSTFSWSVGAFITKQQGVNIFIVITKVLLNQHEYDIN